MIPTKTQSFLFSISIDWHTFMNSEYLLNYTAATWSVAQVSGSRLHFRLKLILFGIKMQMYKSFKRVEKGQNYCCF